MAIMQNANDPLTVKNVDPKLGTIVRDPDEQYWEGQVKKTRLQREFKQEKKLMEEVDKPEAPPEPGFRVTGGVNLGTIDLQEQQRLAKEDAIKMQQDAQARVERAEKTAADARDALNKANLEHMQQVLGGQIAQLQQAMQSGKPKDIFAELENIETAATKLGFTRGNGQSSGLDGFKAQIELKRLEQEIARENRKFAQEMKRDERMWQLELKKLDQQSREAEARLDAEKNKWNMIASLPEQLGGVVAKGLIDHSLGAGGVATQPQPQANPQRPRTVEADEGAAGQFPCPVCQSPVGIGPTSEGAVCAKCGQTFNVTRTKAPGAASPETGAEAIH
jgi:hypothetical protein